MKSCAWIRALSALGVIWLLGCQGDESPGAAGARVGSVRTSLQLEDGSEISTLAYAISGPHGYTRAGTVDVTDSTRPSFRVGDIPIDPSPYSLSVTATTSTGATCAGSAPFSISTSGATGLTLSVACRSVDAAGDVEVQVDLEVEVQTCPAVQGVQALPNETRIGTALQLEAALTSASEVRWTGEGGTFSEPTALTTAFTCEVVGTHVLTVAIDAPPCDHAVDLEIACSAPPAIDAGSDAASEPLAFGLDARASNPTCLAPAGGAELPGLLSQTGCFDPADPRAPLAALNPYDVNAALWSDGAAKRRWFALPDGATVTLGEDGDLVFPVGAVLVKEFRLGERLLETRFLVFQPANPDEAGAAPQWAGYAYRWNDAQTDAALVIDGTDNDIALDPDTAGLETWHIPTRTQCRTCHTFVAGFSLGLELAQLHRDFSYPATGRSANQLLTLEHIGVFAAALPGSPDSWPRLAPYDDPAASLEQRARSYLHVNCSMCHRKPLAGGTAYPAPEDFRATLPFAQMHACNETPRTSAASRLGMDLTRARILVPGSPEDSVLWRRMDSRPAQQMPPLGTQLVDPLGSGLVESWIASLSGCPE